MEQSSLADQILSIVQSHHAIALNTLAWTLSGCGPVAADQVETALRHLENTRLIRRAERWVCVHGRPQSETVLYCIGDIYRQAA